LGCSNTNGIPSTPSQKSIEVCRSAPTSVMWWTPWVWILRMVIALQSRSSGIHRDRCARYRADMRRPVRVTPRGVLFVALAAGLFGIGYAAATAGRWEIAVPAAALGLWMLDLALRDLGIRRFN
jgi:hypothetical protein